MQSSFSIIDALQAQQKSARKEQGALQTAPQAPHSARDQLTSRGKRKHTEQAVASAGVPAAAVRAGAESFKDIQMAQYLRKVPATPAAHAKRKAAGPGAGGTCWHASPNCR